MELGTYATSTAPNSSPSFPVRDAIFRVVMVSPGVCEAMSTEICRNWGATAQLWSEAAWAVACRQRDRAGVWVMGWDATLELQGSARLVCGGGGGGGGVEESRHCSRCWRYGREVVLWKLRWE